MKSDSKKCCMYGSTSVKTSVNPVCYIRIFVRPDKLVLKVDHMCTLWLALLVFYVVSKYPRMYEKLFFFYILCGYFTEVCILGTCFYWFLCCFNSTAVFTVDPKYSSTVIVLFCFYKECNARFIFIFCIQ
jgi:hypothetical protein